MRYQGKFHIELPHLILPKKRKLILPNTFLSYGCQLILTNFFQNTGSVPAPFYIGLTSVNYTFTSLLSDVAAGEPTGGGYARQSVARSGAGWTVTETNNQWSAVSATVNFTASGNWTGSWIRAFLCDAASGTVGNLLACSAALPAAVTTLAGQAPSTAYEADLRG